MTIKRRDFLQGSAIALAGSTLAPELAVAANALKEAYPPSKTGLRGNHPGSFEVAHQMGWMHKKFERPQQQTDDTYDLVIVGGGLSGLAAAWYYRERFGDNGRVLIIDNHDDFGGHAKRNEFEETNTVGYGGSQTIDSPKGTYSEHALRILNQLGIDLKVFNKAYDRQWAEQRGLRNALELNSEAFGKASVCADPFDIWSGNPVKGKALKEALAVTPLNDNEIAQIQDFVTRVFYEPRPLYAGLDVDETIKRARSQSLKDYLEQELGYSQQVTSILIGLPKGLWGMAGDLLSVYDTFIEMSDYVELNLAHSYDSDDEPYIYHFPDGNAGVARMMVRRLIPGVAPGDDMFDINRAQFNYDRLDIPSNSTRIRLNSTVTDVRHRGELADICYRQFDKQYRVTGKKVVMACYMHMLPYICPELPKAQVEAMKKLEKVPMIVGNVALKNWQFIKDSGFSGCYSPGREFIEMRVDFPVSLGDVKFAQSPDEPIVINFWGTPTPNGPGLDVIEQLIAGKHKIYNTSFASYEQQMLSQMHALWGDHGFDPDKQVSAITVNRWPHGYAYEYISRFDPEFDSKNGPHITARKGWKNLAIANSDSEAKAYVNGAFDAAHRAIDELYS